MYADNLFQADNAWSEKNYIHKSLSQLMELKKKAWCHHQNRSIVRKYRINSSTEGHARDSGVGQCGQFVDYMVSNYQAVKRANDGCYMFRSR